MLHEFLTANRQELIGRCRAKVAMRFEPTADAAVFDHGVPLFLQQLVEILREEQTNSAPADTEAEQTPAPTQIGRAAALHGAELLRLGFSVDQVVHDYGDVCQSVTALAGEMDESISIDEFRTLNRCLDNAIADAVASFGEARQISITHQTETLQIRLATFSDEHRRLVEICLQALGAIRTGNIGPNGATGTLLAHALEELRSLADRTLPEIRHISSGAKAT